MKKLLIPILGLFLLASCSKDECTQDQFVGTYVGTKTCDSGANDENFVTTIEAGPGSNEVIFTVDGTPYTLKIDECTARFSNKVFGIGEEVSLTRAEDGTLSGKSEIDALITIGCNYELTPQ